MSAWYAVFCKPRREELAEANFVNQGYRVFLPRLATQRRRDGVFDVETGEDRVFVLLEFLGKINKVKVCRDWLVPAT